MRKVRAMFLNSKTPHPDTPGVRLYEMQILSNGAQHLLMLNVSSAGEISLLDWHTCVVMYSNASSLESGGYKTVKFPTFYAYDFYKSQEWRDYEKFSEWYRKNAMWHQLERLPESHAIKLVWLSYKGREEKAVLLLRYFKASERLEGSRAFWEAQGDAETARRSWIRDALDHARMTEEQYQKAGFLADTEAAL